MSPLTLIGLCLFVAAQVWFVVEAFRQGVWWGLGMLIIPFVSIMFLARHWSRARWPFFVQISGLALCVAEKVMNS